MMTTCLILLIPDSLEATGTFKTDGFRLIPTDMPTATTATKTVNTATRIGCSLAQRLLRMSGCLRSPATCVKGLKCHSFPVVARSGMSLTLTTIAGARYLSTCRSRSRDTRQREIHTHSPQGGATPTRLLTVVRMPGGGPPPTLPQPGRMTGCIEAKHRCPQAIVDCCQFATTSSPAVNLYAMTVGVALSGLEWKMFPAIR